MRAPFIQIAGIRNLAEAQMLMDAGVEYLGFPLRLPVHKADLTEEEARVVISHIKAPHRAVLITYLDQASEIIPFMKELNVTAVQLHGAISVSELIKLREQREFLIIKSLVIRDGNDTAISIEMLECEPFVDAFITDTYDPVSGASGATGKTHDWDRSRALVLTSQKPIILAGGLRAENVSDAIQAVQPFGVDSHTGVEDAQGNKDPIKVREFMDAVLKTYEGMR